MAETFTGLKLQGDIGRRERGPVRRRGVRRDARRQGAERHERRLLMWDGGLIRAVLLRGSRDDGMIELMC